MEKSFEPVKYSASEKWSELRVSESSDSFDPYCYSVLGCCWAMCLAPLPTCSTKAKQTT